jgi:hypothetical protein
MAMIAMTTSNSIRVKAKGAGETFFRRVAKGGWDERLGGQVLRNLPLTGTASPLSANGGEGRGEGAFLSL